MLLKQEVRALIPGWGTKISQAMQHGEIYIYIYTGHQDMQHILSHIQSDVHQPWHVKSVPDPVSTGPTPLVTDTGDTQVGQACSD